MCDNWAALDPAQPALIHETATDTSLASPSVSSGGEAIRQIRLAQSPQTAFAHIAAFKAGAFSVPLFALFGEEALEYRLPDSGASVLVTDTGGARKIAVLRQKLPALVTVLVTDSDSGVTAVEGTENFDDAIDAESEAFEPGETNADDPEVIIYTSGTTGKPKGALHAHPFCW
ncbi:AMP-binding protein, partial [Paraburkholderia xenovorans]|uniref:AMP-binding protein n=1 Tax=Paraburkholderia xenovorans TaxID=36873 RepID=UPI0038BDD728